METKKGAIINVIIADDNVHYKTAVKTALSFKEDIRLVADADNGSHLLNLLKTIQPPDVILLDIQMPVMDGIATLPELKKWYPDIKVIMLTMMDDQNMRDKLINMGANRYLLKTSDSRIIYEAIKACYEEKFYSSSLGDKRLINNLREKSPSHVRSHPEEAMLSEREVTVLRLICEGKSTLEIIGAVELNVQGLEEIMDRLKTKTGVRSTIGLIKYAGKNNLFKQDI